MERKYLPTLSDLIDRLSITQLKEILIPEHRAEYSEEIKLLLHDIDVVIKETNVQLDAGLVRDIALLMLYNRQIWLNEAACRQGMKEGNDLYLSHSLNGWRSRCKNRIQQRVGGRKDYKLDVIDGYPEWGPSWQELST